MILIIQIHSIPFHYYEFVKPIEEVIRSSGTPFSSVHYRNITDERIKNAEKIIIAGTSLKDTSYLNDVEKFSWIHTINIPVLGICGGMQILSAFHGEPILKGQEIGLTTINLKQEFLGLIGDLEVYELHNNYVNPNIFETLGHSDQYPQAIKHPEKPFYGVLFHPEVRNKKMLTHFINDI